MIGSVPTIPAEARLDDRNFFATHKDRRLRIRKPIGVEYIQEFRQFGMHDETRRRIIVSRIPAGLAKRYNLDLMRIPFLLFADETVEDRDAVLAPILDELMRNARQEMGV